jgi:hypothetical protein
MSPGTLRSQLKLYQPVENSVNENRIATGVPRAIPSLTRDCSHRQAYIRVCYPLHLTDPAGSNAFHPKADLLVFAVGREQRIMP